jgi:nucleoside recognition membrane protein YjiH
MEPLMRPIWKVPGRAAVNAIASFVSSSSVGVLITSKLYKRGVYTEKEAVLVATGFSAVSIGFAYMVIKTAGLQDHFIMVYFSSLVITLVVSAVIARIPPFSKKNNVYLDGREQTQQDIEQMRTTDKKLLKTALDRAVKKAYTAPPLLSELKSSLKDGLEVMPKVITLLASIGTASLIIAENTPVFDWIGSLFIPLLNLLNVPNAVEIAPSFPVGIAEMFLPVLLIADKIDVLDIGARYVVTAVSIVQIIFFAETVVVMMASKLPLKLWELVVVFIERTFFAIIVASMFMRVLF